jgi:serine/threonine-protein kinase
MTDERQYAVLGPLPSTRETRAFLGVEVVEGRVQRDHPVVVAWLPTTATTDPKQVARLQRETAFVTTLAHPNIVRVHGLECFQEGWARVTDYVDAESLASLLDLADQRGLDLPAEVVARIVADAAGAVAYAHETGLQSLGSRPVVHGAVRLDTLLVGFDGRTRLSGYGAGPILLEAGPDEPRSHLAFLAPEQIIGGRSTISPGTDVYGLGATLYALLVRKLPFADAEDLEQAILSHDPAWPAFEGPKARLLEVARVAMAKRGNLRFSTAQAMRQAVLESVGGEPGLAEHVEVATVFSSLVSVDAPERVARRQLLEQAGDLNALTTLGRPSQPPAGVDPALHEASRPPRPASVRELPRLSTELGGPAAPARSAPPRESETIVDGRPPERPAADRAAPDRSETVRGEPYTQLGAKQLTENTDRIDRRAVQNALPSVRASQDPQAVPQPIMPTHVAPAYAQPHPSGPAPAGYPAPPAYPTPGVPPSPYPTPSPYGVPGAPTPYATPMMPMGVPQGTMPHGMPQVPMGQPMPGMMPGTMPGAHPSVPPMRPSMSPGVAYGGTGNMPQLAGGMMMGGTGNMPQMTRPSVPPGYLMPSIPPGGTGNMPQLARGSIAPGGMIPSVLVGTGNMPVVGTGNMAAVARGSIAPGGTGNMPAIARGSLPPNAVQSPTISGKPPIPQGPVPRAPIREVSSMTAFKKDAGDSSRAVLFASVAVLVGVIGFVVAFPKEAPKELGEESSRHALPKELVKQAFDNKLEAPVPAAAQVEEPAPTEAPAPSPSVAGAAAPEATPSPVEEPKTGFVNVSTDPPVDVYDGAQLLGRTPFRAELRSGAHNLRFTDKGKLINLYKSVRVKGGADARVAISFGTSVLNVDAPPGSVVMLNGKGIGTAPIGAQTIYEGRYVLKVVHEGKSWSETFDAPSGKTIEYKVSVENR